MVQSGLTANQLFRSRGLKMHTVRACPAGALMRHGHLRDNPASPTPTPLQPFPSPSPSSLFFPFSFLLLYHMDDFPFTYVLLMPQQSTGYAPSS
jgi:hypothetical protein